MINKPKEFLPISKTPAEKSLPVDQSPIFDRADDPNNEDFVNANDPERKFIPINEVEDKDADFTEKMDDEEETEDEVSEEQELDEVWQAMQEDSSKEELDKVRKDIGHYAYTGPDSESTPLASFHIDHDNEEVTAIAEEGLEPVKTTDPENIEDAPLEEELADNNIVTDRKMSPGGKPVERVGKHKIGQSNASDNLKTMPENKVQRSNRGLIRKFLDNVWNKN